MKLPDELLVWKKAPKHCLMARVLDICATEMGYILEKSQLNQDKITILISTDQVDQSFRALSLSSLHL